MLVVFKSADTPHIHNSHPKKLTHRYWLDCLELAAASCSVILPSPGSDIEVSAQGSWLKNTRNITKQEFMVVKMLRQD